MIGGKSLQHLTCKIVKDIAMDVNALVFVGLYQTPVGQHFLQGSFELFIGDAGHDSEIGKGDPGKFPLFCKIGEDGLVVVPGQAGHALDGMGVG